MAEIKFYQDAAKTTQVYPEINPDGNYPGVTVGLADNLVSDQGIIDEDTWQYRSSGGELDISDGYAELMHLVGYTESSTIEEAFSQRITGSGVTGISLNTTTFKTQISTSGVYNFIYRAIMSYASGDPVNTLDKSVFANAVSLTTGTYVFTWKASDIIKVDQSSLVTSWNANTFASKVNGVINDYVFTYDGSNWKLSGNTVTMSQYGMTTSGSEQEGDTITIEYNANSWFISDSAVSITAYGIVATGSQSLGDTITITYTGNQWELNNTAVTLSDYGITITEGTAAIDDNIQINYTAEQLGAVVTSNPSQLLSIGMNQFNKDGTQIFSGRTIDNSGNIVAETGKYVIYFKCTDETYTIYNDTANAIIKVGYSESIPTTTSSVTLLTPVTSSEWATVLVNDTHKEHYTVNEGYLCVATTDINNLCCHLTWEADEFEDTYESYYESFYTIPYSDVNGTVISEYGLVNLYDENDQPTDYYDEIDFTDHKFYKRTARLPYSAANLATVQALDVPYKYDDNYIYYGIDTIVYTLEDTASTYRISNYGTEEFVGSALELDAMITYQDNLKAKLKNSVEVIDNKIDTIDTTSSNYSNEYPSALCLNKYMTGQTPIGDIVAGLNTTNKNLFNIANTKAGSLSSTTGDPEWEGGVTYNITNTYSSSATIATTTAWRGFRSTDLIPVNADSYYTLSMTTDSDTLSAKLIGYNTSFGFTEQVTKVNLQTTGLTYAAKFLTGSSTRYVRIVVLESVANKTATINNIQFEKGEINTKFVPYGMHKLHEYWSLGKVYADDFQSKNLFGGFIYSRTSNGLTYQYTGDGTIYVNGTATAGSVSMLDSQKIGITLPAGRYCLQCDRKDANVTVELRKLDTGSLWKSFTNANYGIFSTSEEASVYVRLSIASGTYNNIPFRIQIEKLAGAFGATPWSAHKHNPNMMGYINTYYSDNQTATTQDAAINDFRVWLARNASQGGAPIGTYNINIYFNGSHWSAFVNKGATNYACAWLTSYQTNHTRFIRCSDSSGTASWANDCIVKDYQNYMSASYSIAVGKNRSITCSGSQLWFLIMISTSNGAGYGSYLFRSYGDGGTARTKYTSLLSDSNFLTNYINITITGSPNKITFKNVNSSAGLNLYLFPLNCSRVEFTVGDQVSN